MIPSVIRSGLVMGSRAICEGAAGSDLGIRHLREVCSQQRGVPAPPCLPHLEFIPHSSLGVMKSKLRTAAAPEEPRTLCSRLPKRHSHDSR